MDWVTMSDKSKVVDSLPEIFPALNPAQWAEANVAQISRVEVWGPCCEKLQIPTKGRLESEAEA